VYRDGDRNAASVADLVVLHSTVRGFKAGSERARQVTTVSGATSITVHCQFTSSDGTSLVAQDVNGKVRFFGGNLKATYDFAKKAARVANENFSRPVASNDQERKPVDRGGLLLMLALYSNPKWLSVVRGTVERLTETLDSPSRSAGRSHARLMKL